MNSNNTIHQISTQTTNYTITIDRKSEGMVVAEWVVGWLGKWVDKNIGRLKASGAESN